MQRDLHNTVLSNGSGNWFSGVKIFCRIFFKETYLILLPFYFVINGFADFFELVYFPTVLHLLFDYLAGTVVLFFFVFLFLKDIRKASIASFLYMVYYLYFGIFHERIQTWLPISFFARYTFLIPATIVAAVIFLLLLKRTRRPLSRISSYLNVLMIILILIDIVRLGGKLAGQRVENRQSQMSEFQTNRILQKPDVYFILCDGYPGELQLKGNLGFDNHKFEDSLSNMGFHVVKDSRSNYNSTPFSLASTLNMEYLQNITGNHENIDDIKFCYKKINRNKAVAFFKYEGYEFINNSIFNVDDVETQSSTTLFPTKGKLISRNTIFSCLERDAGVALYSQLHMDWKIKEVVYSVRDYNNKAVDRILRISEQPSAKPRLVYTHLLMPHYPYYYDSCANPYPLTSIVDRDLSPPKFVSYLQYSNKVILKLVDSLLSRSHRKAIIILMGDHGYREYKDPRGIDNSYFFSCLNSVFLPSQNYRQFYDGMSNVNEFRVVFNTEFSQNLSLLPDKSILNK